MILKLTDCLHDCLQGCEVALLSQGILRPNLSFRVFQSVTNSSSKQRSLAVQFT